MPIPPFPHPLPVTNDTVQDAYDWMFAPWVKALGLRDFQVSPGKASAVLPQSAPLQFVGGAVCGQAIMAAVDSVAALAMTTSERWTRGTVYQHVHFLRAAAEHDMRVDANVLRFGKSSAFIEAKVSFIHSGELVAHATLEFAM